MGSQKVFAIKGGSTTVAVTDGSLDTQTELEVTGQAGSVLQGTASITRHQPRARVTIEDVQAAMSLFGLTGYEVPAGGVELWTVKRDQGGGLLTTGNKVAFTDGIVVPESLSANTQQLASIEYSVYGGGAASAVTPYAISLDQSVPTVTSLAQEMWTLGPATLNAADIGPVQSLQVNFGPQIEHQHGGDDVYSHTVSIDQWQIDGTLETENPDVMNTVDEGDTNTLGIQLSKKASGGIAGSGHLSIAFDASITVLDQMQGDSRSSATTTLRFTATSSDYSTFPISISV